MKLPKVVMLRTLLYWMEERQRISLKRRAGEPFPWTSDPILTKFRFCEVYREQDRVTRWIRENWREPYANHPNLWFAMCIARQINWPDTLQAIGFPEAWEPKRVLKILEARKKAGEKTYTSAYLLGGGNKAGGSKIHYTVRGILNPLWKANEKEKQSDGAEFPNTLERFFSWLIQFHGFGKFLAYEVVTDLRHTHYLENAPDIQTWANIGPGAQRGSNRLYQRNLNGSHTQESLLEELLQIMAWIKCERDPSLLPALEARDIEHSLCELSKYVRMKEYLQGKGPRASMEIFKPASARLF